MTTTSADDRPLVRISKVAGRYLLFDIEDVMYLRRNYNICSVFVGTIPQNPQQNLFMGLPLELMPEEAQVLVEKNVARVVDDDVFHPSQLAAFDESSRRAYVQSLKNQGKQMQMAVTEAQNRNKPKQQGKSKKNKSKTEAEGSNQVPATEADETSLFDSTPATPKQTDKVPEVEGYLLTPTTSSFLLPSPSRSVLECPAAVDVPVSYPLFAHLLDRGYYMMPGLRFGCDYNVYPGDPLRFHSHFAGVHFGWDEEITMMDLVGGGRLGTSVKKGYLIGGAVVEEPNGEQGNLGHDVSQGEADAQPRSKGEPVAPPVRTFCLEWAGM